MQPGKPIHSNSGGGFGPSTGLYNYDARHYDPAIGRFISPDSLIPNAYDPQQLNPYAYCRNNPLIYVDPSGHYTVGGEEGRDPTGGALAGGSLPGRLSSLWSNDRSGGFLADNATVLSDVGYAAYAKNLLKVWEAKALELGFKLGSKATIAVEGGTFIVVAGGTYFLYKDMDEYAEKNKHGGLQGWFFGPLESYFFGDKALGAKNQTTETTTTAATGSPNTNPDDDGDNGDDDDDTISRLHSDETIDSSNKASYDYWSKQDTDKIVESLKPGTKEPLTVNENNVIMQGNTRTRAGPTQVKNPRVAFRVQ